MERLNKRRSKILAEGSHSKRQKTETQRQFNEQQRERTATRETRAQKLDMLKTINNMTPIAKRHEQRNYMEYIVNETLEIKTILETIDRYHAPYYHADFCLHETTLYPLPIKAIEKLLKMREKIKNIKNLPKELSKLANDYQISKGDFKKFVNNKINLIDLSISKMNETSLDINDIKSYFRKYKNLSAKLFADLSTLEQFKEKIDDLPNHLFKAASEGMKSIICSTYNRKNISRFIEKELKGNLSDIEKVPSFQEYFTASNDMKAHLDEIEKKVSKDQFLKLLYPYAKSATKDEWRTMEQGFYFYQNAISGLNLSPKEQSLLEGQWDESAVMGNPPVDSSVQSLATEIPHKHKKIYRELRNFRRYQKMSGIENKWIQEGRNSSDYCNNKLAERKATGMDAKAIKKIFTNSYRHTEYSLKDVLKFQGITPALILPQMKNGLIEGKLEDYTVSVQWAEVPGSNNLFKPQNRGEVPLVMLVNQKIGSMVLVQANKEAEQKWRDTQSSQSTALHPSELIPMAYQQLVKKSTKVSSDASIPVKQLVGVNLGHPGSVEMLAGYGELEKTTIYKPGQKEFDLVMNTQFGRRWEYMKQSFPEIVGQAEVSQVAIHRAEKGQLYLKLWLEENEGSDLEPSV